MYSFKKEVFFWDFTNLNNPLNPAILSYQNLYLTIFPDVFLCFPSFIRDFPARGWGSHPDSRSPEATTQFVVVVAHPFPQPLGVQKLLTREGLHMFQYLNGVKSNKGI